MPDTRKPYTNKPIFIGIVDDCRSAVPVNGYRQNYDDIRKGTEPLLAHYIIRSHLREGETPHESAQHFLKNHVLYQERLRLETLGISFVLDQEPVMSGEYKNPHFDVARLRHPTPFGS